MLITVIKLNLLGSQNALLEKYLHKITFLNNVLKNYIREKFQDLQSFIGFPYQLFRHINLLKKINFQYSSSIIKTNISKKFLKELILNFKISIKKTLIEENESHWNPIFKKYHLKLTNIILNNENKTLEILNDPGSTNLFYGFDSNCITLKKKPRYIDKYENSLKVIDKILSFAEFLNIKRIDNPERYQIRKKINLNDLIDKIEQKIQINLDFKNPFPGEEGIEIKNGILCNREIQAIYQAYKIKEISKSFNNPSIVEIGGGLGRTAYYCSKFNIRNYTIVDIPVSSLCQANYLARMIGEKNVLLDNKFKIYNDENKCKIISPETYFSSNVNFDLSFNADSLTEIDVNTQKKYINSFLLRSKLFYSINHEDNLLTVSSHFNNNYESYSRNLYWLRRGYVEEIFAFK